MTLRIASEKYDTAIMKDDEVELFTLAAYENNGGNIDEAVKDMRMIDTMLHMVHLHKAVHVHVKKTGTGYTRKQQGFLDSLNNIVDGRLNDAF
ncbi:hypothetical protein ACFOW1_09630 [Parasediminibacterium paludis]|uniref:Uncharacterized protein n=1 Tax=Parasediminibacterium paludis TaxID=908966 RepID=A0ABV8PZQ6_9BACT